MKKIAWTTLQIIGGALWAMGSMLAVMMALAALILGLQALSR